MVCWESYEVIDMRAAHGLVGAEKRPSSKKLGSLVETEHAVTPEHGEVPRRDDFVESGIKNRSY